METGTTINVRSTDGTAISAYRSGVGPPLILVPGAGAANPVAWPVFARLAQRFTVYAMDRRGHGKSGDHAAYAIQREFEDVAALIDSSPEPANVVGHSFGGICSLEAALLTQNIRRLVLYEPLSIPAPGNPVYRDGFIDRLEALLDAGDREAVLNLHYREIAGMSSEEIDQIRSSPTWQDRIAYAHTLPRELRADESYRFDAMRFEQLRVPTLLLSGGNSRVFEKTGIALLAAALPNNRVANLPGQGHVAMYTAPDLFLDHVLDFLSSTSI